LNLLERDRKRRDVLVSCWFTAVEVVGDNVEK
jgi:hypothetical protein